MKTGLGIGLGVGIVALLLIPQSFASFTDCETACWNAYFATVVQCGETYSGTMTQCSKTAADGMIAAWDERTQDLSNCEELEGIAALECELAAELAHNEKLEKIGDALYACQFGALVAYVNCLNAAEKAYDECVAGCGE